MFWLAVVQQILITEIVINKSFSTTVPLDKLSRNLGTMWECKQTIQELNLKPDEFKIGQEKINNMSTT